MTENEKEAVVLLVGTHLRNWTKMDEVQAAEVAAQLRAALMDERFLDRAVAAVAAD